MNFYIQASNPQYHNSIDPNDECLAEAIENAFPMSTENAILTWNYISIPLSYKYDISYMADDILKLLYALQNETSGKLMIHWLPDTFRCDWSIVWNAGEIEIQSQWECIVGHLERILNEQSVIRLSISDFVKEWKQILGVVIRGLENCGYDKKRIRGMVELIEQYNKISATGILYK